MNIKLAFTPVSQTPVDLLVFVLDAEQALHEVDDRQVLGHVPRAAAAVRRRPSSASTSRPCPEGAVARGPRRPTGARASRAGTSGRT